jgi:DNA-binding Lrp family transcriptional regulator
MRTGPQSAQSTVVSLIILSINTEQVLVSLYTMTTVSPGRVDHLDAALIELLTAEPRIGVLEASRRLRVARGTVQARLERLHERGVITGYGPDVDPAALGYEVTAFITLEIRQPGGHDPVAERLAAIPEVLEVHTITGAGDMLCRVVARSNADMQRVLDAIVSTEGVIRSSTLISLAAQVRYRVLPLVRSAAEAARLLSSCWHHRHLSQYPGASSSASHRQALNANGADARLLVRQCGLHKASNLILTCAPSRMGGNTRTRGGLASTVGLSRSGEARRQVPPPGRKSARRTRR